MEQLPSKFNSFFSFRIQATFFPFQVTHIRDEWHVFCASLGNPQSVPIGQHHKPPHHGYPKDPPERSQTARKGQDGQEFWDQRSQGIYNTYAEIP